MQIMASSSDLVKALQKLEQTMMQGFDKMEERCDQMNERFVQVNGCFDRLDKQLKLNNQLELARSFNAMAVKESDSLLPLPTHNRDAIPKGRFPATVGALRRLSGKALADLIMRYEIVDVHDIPVQVAGRGKLVAEYLGSRWFS
ncbi:hypothetical protein ACGC1H_003279 [Rhizoctonia solani]|uniref:Uncharacterized protein n=1 Tax=Rhizoctonia solani TaxID=456999 RepID=A0A8H3H2C0_9AGAM|nr:unnamed protein product [Rhizoctonia solani]